MVWWSSLFALLFLLLESLLLRALFASWAPVASVHSFALRLLAYIFLRWIPAQHLSLAIVALYGVWAFSYWNVPCPRPAGFDRGNLISKLTIDPLQTPSKPALTDQNEPSQSHSVADQLASSEAVLLDSKDLPASDVGLPSSVGSKDSPQSYAQVVAHPTRSMLKQPVQEASHDTKLNQPTETSPLLPNSVSSTPSTAPEPKSRSSGPVRFFKSLLGLTTDSKGLNRFVLLVNTSLLLFTLDATFRTLYLNGEEDVAFVRVGAVGETWAKIHARIPPGPEDLSVGAIVIYRPMKPVGDWIVGPKLLTSHHTDWNSVIKVDELWPGTSYEYRLTSLSSAAAHHVRFPNVGRFRTVPDSRLVTDGGHFTFGYTSCIKPGFPYNPFRSPLHNDGADQLTEVAHNQNLDFILFLGDFIYADSPYYAGNRVEDYWRKYRQTYATEGWKKLLQFVRTIHIYDDHEIFNDWAGQGNDTNPIFAPANQAYNHYLGLANYDGPGQGQNYFWFRHGDAAFFVWDCRRYRSANEQTDDESKTMLGQAQKQIFFDWLGAVNSTVTFKFVVSSTPFMTLWSGPDGAIDTWAGFVSERSELMDVMQYIPNLIVLSGDRHEFAAATIRDTVIEFSTSPLNQFWLPIKTLSQENGLGQTKEDKLLKYIPEGNHKFSTITVDTRDLKQPKLKFNLFIDGEVAWNLTYVGKSITDSPQQLGELFPTWEQFMKLWQPIKWLTF